MVASAHHPSGLDAGIEMNAMDSLVALHDAKKRQQW